MLFWKWGKDVALSSFSLLVAFILDLCANVTKVVLVSELSIVFGSFPLQNL
jgi:hypothetical protein